MLIVLIKPFENKEMSIRRTGESSGDRQTQKEEGNFGLLSKKLNIVKAKVQDITVSILGV